VELCAFRKLDDSTFRSDKRRIAQIPRVIKSKFETFLRNPSRFHAIRVFVDRSRSLILFLEAIQQTDAKIRQRDQKRVVIPGVV